MRRLPPRSTRTDTRFPYTTLFRSNSRRRGCQPRARKSAMRRRERRFAPFPRARAAARRPGMTDIAITPEIVAEHGLTPAGYQVILRSEERRVGKEGVRTVRSRWSPSHYKKKKKKKKKRQII